MPEHMELFKTGNKTVFPIYNADSPTGVEMSYLTIKGIGERPFYAFEWHGEKSLEKAIKEFQKVLDG